MFICGVVYGIPIDHGPLFCGMKLDLVDTESVNEHRLLQTKSGNVWLFTVLHRHWRSRERVSLREGNPVSLCVRHSVDRDAMNCSVRQKAYIHDVFLFGINEPITQHDCGPEIINIFSVT